MKHVKTILMIIMFVGIMHQQALLQETNQYLDVIYKAFVTCVETRYEIQGQDPI